MILKVLKNSGVIKPPSQNGDAGYDIVASSEPEIVGSIYQYPYYTSVYYVEYNTKIKIEPEKGDGDYDFFNLIYPRSSISNTNLSLCNSVGVIDSGYRGDLILRFKYIAQPEDMKIIEGVTVYGEQSSGIVTSINPQRIYQKGDKIAQIIPCKHNKIQLEYIDCLTQSKRGEGGFGSTGA